MSYKRILGDLLAAVLMLPIIYIFIVLLIGYGA